MLNFTINRQQFIFFFLFSWKIELSLWNIHQCFLENKIEKYTHLLSVDYAFSLWKILPFHPQVSEVDSFIFFYFLFLFFFAFGHVHCCK